MLDNRQIMRNEQVRQPEFLLQVFEQIQNLRLNRNIQRGDRLVADDQLRLERERPGNADALPLPARKLVGVAVYIAAGEADEVHELHHFGIHFLPAHLAVNLHRGRNDLPHRLAGVQRIKRLLKHHAHAFALRAHLFFRERRQVLAVKTDLARIRRNQLQQGAGERAFSAPGFPNQTEALAAVNLKADIVYGVYHTLRRRKQPGFDRKGFGNVFYIQQYFIQAAFPLS